MTDTDKNNHATILESKRTEWVNLRNEISNQDGLCQTILAFLMTVSMTSYTLYFEGTSKADGAGGIILLGASSLVWLLGYYYLLEKRFLIGRMAYYLRTEVEQKDLGLNYETWVADNRGTLEKRFLRKKPYKIETAD